MAEGETGSGAAAAAEKVRAILEAAERETESQLRRVGETADRLGARADEIESRLEALADEVRAAIRELREDLRGLRDLRPERVEEPEPEPVPADPAPDPAPAPTPPPASSPVGNEGARVIALNMALSGSSREETAAYLAENFELDDSEALLDEVYARAGG